MLLNYLMCTYHILLTCLWTYCTILYFCILWYMLHCWRSSGQKNVYSEAYEHLMMNLWMFWTRTRTRSRTRTRTRTSPLSLGWADLPHIRKRKLKEEGWAAKSWRWFCPASMWVPIDWRRPSGRARQVGTRPSVHQNQWKMDPDLLL